MNDVTTIYTEDVSSGMGHVRVSVGGTILTSESDNLDDAGEYRVITKEEFYAKDREHLCRRCVPDTPPENDVVPDQPEEFA